MYLKHKLHNFLIIRWGVTCLHNDGTNRIGNYIRKTKTSLLESCLNQGVDSSVCLSPNMFDFKRTLVSNDCTTYCGSESKFGKI